ncbi:MAG: methyltransferase domain-containing protein [Sphingobacteriales bacterium]|nr:methyltransferase domain-containing protein [Sphingobacteriales bacterium]
MSKIEQNEANQPSLDQTFWNERWQTQQTGWDIGHAAPAICNYIAQYPNKQAAILIPGCGNAHEAHFLIQQGFTNITLLDIAPLAVEQVKEKFAPFPEVKVVCANFFEHQPHTNYDLILEQTFFCALHPDLRPNYVQKMASLLKPEGKLVGLLFAVQFEKRGPPFGGTITDYLSIFAPYFDFKTLAPCYNSIAPRANTELFMIAYKR